MPGFTIGKKMGLGYAGNVARSIDSIITPKTAKENINFGAPVVLNSDGTVSPFGASNTATDFVGIAIREVKQAISYSDSVSYYEANEKADILSRGTICIKVNHGTATPGGKVYIRIAENSSITNGVVGGFEAEADSTNTIEVPNARFTTGEIDSNGIAEITILERLM